MMGPQLTDDDYWSTDNERLSIKVVLITENDQPPPCFAGADTLVVNPRLGSVLLYRYSRHTHHLVDIPESHRLSPNVLHKLLKKALMLVVIYDHRCRNAGQIVATIPHVTGKSLELSILCRVEEPSNFFLDENVFKSVESIGHYDCHFNAKGWRVAYSVIQVLVEASTLKSPVSTDFADVKAILSGGKRLRVAIASGQDEATATRRAMNALGFLAGVTRIFSAMQADYDTGIDGWDTAARLIEGELGTGALFIAALQIRRPGNGCFKQVLIAVED